MKYFEIIPSEIDNYDLENMLYHYRTQIAWTQDSYNFGGKIVTPRRKTFMFGKDYVYSGQVKKAIPYDELTNNIRLYLEGLLGLKEELNGCLLNLYPDGEASISYHADDEKSMKSDTPIVVLSLGATRKFLFKDKETKEVIHLEIKNGEILIMHPGCQSKYLHSIPKENKVFEPRISLTFRTFL